MKTHEINIDIPDGYEIDEQRSTLTKIVFKKIPKEVYYDGVVYLSVKNDSSKFVSKTARFVFDGKDLKNKHTIAFNTDSLFNAKEWTRWLSRDVIQPVVSLKLNGYGMLSNQSEMTYAHRIMFGDAVSFAVGNMVYYDFDFVLKHNDDEN